MLSGRSRLYMTGPKTFIVLKNLSFAKSNLLLSFIIQINVIFMFDIFYKKCTLFFFLKVSPRTLLLPVNFFINLLKNIKLSYNLFYKIWISFIYSVMCGTNSSHFYILSKISTLNPLLANNGVLVIVLCSEVLYASIPIDSSSI